MTLQAKTKKHAVQAAREKKLDMLKNMNPLILDPPANAPPPPPPDMARLLSTIAEEWVKLQGFAPLKHDMCPPLRAKNFPYAADSGTWTAFRKLGFEEWLGRSKLSASVDTTFKQLAEFIAWVKHMCPAMIKFVFITVACVSFDCICM
jgi:hypothetical protein